MNLLRTMSGYAGLLILASGSALLRFQPGSSAYGYALMALGGALVLASAWWNRAEWIAFLRGRSFLSGANAVFYVLIVLAILVLVNVLAREHHRRFDTTSARLYSLSDDTTKVLAGLTEGIQAKAFFLPDESRQRFENLLREYQYHTDRLQVDWIDPDRDPAVVKAFDVKVLGTTVFIRGDRQTKITEATEEAVTRALLEITREETSEACFLGGHGERALTDREPDGLSTLRESLEKMAIKTRDVELLRQAQALQGCRVLVIAGPRAALLPAEVEAVRAHLDAGGRLLLLIDPDQTTGLEPLLAAYGVKQLPGIVIDGDIMNRLQGFGVDVPLSAGYGQSEITRDLKLRTFFPIAAAFSLEGSAPAGSVRLVESSGESWNESNPQELASGKVGFTPEADTQGPLALAVQVTRKSEPAAGTTPAGGGTSEARLVVFGDSDFAANRYVSLLGNADLLLNAVVWLAQDKPNVSIPPRAPQVRVVTLTAAEARTLLILSLGVFPLSIAGFGVVQWVRRRRL